MRSATILPALALLGACSGGNAATVSSSAPGTRSFAVGAFDAVVLEGSDDVRVVTGATPGVTATGPEDQLAKLDIRVDGSTLKVGRKSGSWSIGMKGEGVTVTVTTPGINAASITGSGNMSVDKVRGERFTGAVSGSGDFDVADIQVKRADLDLAGSGNLRAAGTAEAAELSIAGSGDIDAEKLATRTVSANIAGSGDIRARASASADVSLVGSGDATIKGTSNCKVTKIGSGEGRCEP